MSGSGNRVSISPNEMRNGKVETDEDRVGKREITMKIGACRWVMVVKRWKLFLS